MHCVKHFVHTANIFCLFFDFHRFNMRAFVLIPDFVDLVFKEFVIVSLFVVDDAGDEE